ncbi:MAG: hypothetical protein ACI8S6_002875, partial [Myxococcota bacterium]
MVWFWALTAAAAMAGERYTVLPLPTIDYTPETGLAGGIVVLATGHPFEEGRQSALEIEGTVTTRRQRVLTTDLQLFLPRDVGLLSISADIMRFPEDFWGVGPDTTEAARERYTADRIELLLEPMWRPWRSVFIGPSAQAQWVYSLEAEPGGLLDSGTVAGADGGRSVGLGGVVLWEGRQRPITPAAGERYLALRQQWYRPGLGSEHRFSRMLLDGRAYLTAGQSIVALQGLALLHGGSPPLRMMALAGGDQIMRGYYTGRYR